jgi:hypothetical protein
MRAWMLLLLVGCGEKEDSASAEGCESWVVCCTWQCGTTAEYTAYLEDSYECDMECDTANPGPLPGECAEDDAGVCGWQ